MVFMDAGLLILHLFQWEQLTQPSLHIGILATQMIPMGVASYLLARVEKQTYNPQNFVVLKIETRYNGKTVSCKCF